MVRFLLLAALAGTSTVALSNVAVNAAPDAAALADHLKASKVVYYGSWRCSACQHQGRLFGDAVNRLPMWNAQASRSFRFRPLPARPLKFALIPPGSCPTAIVVWVCNRSRNCSAGRA